MKVMRMKISSQYMEGDHWKISKLPILEKDEAENRGPFSGKLQKVLLSHVAGGTRLFIFKRFGLRISLPF